MTQSIFIALLFILVRVSCESLSDEANARLPRLFHLDDYDRCLSQKDGLYCLGILELSPIHPSPVYQHIKKYSSNRYTFNRTRLHRGYCVSERCPSRERNATLRFERCVSERARRHALSARLHTLHHCTSHQHHNAKAAQPPNSAQRLFLQIVYAILALNFVGTAYDVIGDSNKKMGILTVWSIRSSWRRLTADYDSGDPRMKELEPLHGIRAVASLFTLYAHVCLFHYQYYVTNPQFLEHLSYRPDGVFMSNGTSLIHVYVLISIFLFSYYLLLYSQTHKLSLLMLPVFILKRVARIAPVHMLMIGFIGTWWPRVYSGPFHSLIEDKSAICRRKFWSYAFFYNNIADKHDQCLVPSWFLPVDMQLQILACILVIIMQHRRHQARRLFRMLFIISSLACGVINYLTGWQAPVYFAVPDNIRGVFDKVESFGEFYTSTWGALPPCFLGLYTAYLYYELRERKYNFSANKWFKFMHHASLMSSIIWVVALGSFVRHYTHPLVVAAYTAVDRPIFITLGFFLIIGVFQIEGLWRSIFNWHGWRVLSRLSLPVMFCHWVINDYVAARPYAYYTSVFRVSIDYFSTVVYAHLIALPIHLLVEIPVQRFIGQIISAVL